MILRFSPTSPFVRKVVIAANILGLQDKIEIEAGNPADPADSLRIQNPLGKVPALILDDGEAIFDSSVIVDTLDTMAGGGIVIPKDPVARRHALTLQALCDGILDASVLIVAESRRSEESERSASWVSYQEGKVHRGLAALEANPPALDGKSPNIGQITLACLLGYRDLRFDEDWREIYPDLANWLLAFEKAVPVFDETRPNP